MEDVLNKLQELKTTKVAIYHSANKDRDKNYAHGAMLAYGAAIQIIESAMAKSSNENNGLNIPVVKPRFSDVEITEKAIKYAKEFEIRDKPIETAKIQGYAVRDYYAGFKAALNGA